MTNRGAGVKILKTKFKSKKRSISRKKSRKNKK